MRSFQVLERHSLDQRRLAGTGLSNDVDMQKTVFVFDTEDAIIIAKVDAGKVNSVMCIHIMHVSSLRSDTCTRLGVLPKSGIRTSIISAESFADLQAGHDCLWQVPSSNEKQGQRDNQNDVDDRRFQQLLFRVCPIEFEG
jgi:hypothetical protein